MTALSKNVKSIKRETEREREVHIRLEIKYNLYFYCFWFDSVQLSHFAGQMRQFPTALDKIHSNKPLEIVFTFPTVCTFFATSGDYWE